jgi:hypothetical protein
LDEFSPLVAVGENNWESPMSDSPMSDDRPRIVKSTTEAREGVTGHNVRYVLLTSLVGAAVILAGLWLFYFA